MGDGRWGAEGAAGGQRAEGAAINHPSLAVAPQMSESEAFAVSLAQKGVTT